MSHTTTYLGHDGCAPDVQTFRFERPEGYEFRAGQFFYLTLATRDGEQSKFFTHADAPGDDHIELTTRLSGSAFKDALLALEPGDAITFDGPLGDLAVPEGATSIGFFTGGVGITPAHSIIRDAKLRNLPLKIVLFYGNREPQCIPYADEFRGYAAQDTSFNYVEVVEHPDDAWTGPVGYVTPDLVRATLDPLQIDSWIVCGPPGMVGAMERLVSALEIPAARVQVEQFMGY